MQIKYLFGVVLIGLLVSIMSFISAFAAPRQPLYGTVVVIDPGHGGRDPGAHGVFIDPQTRERVTVPKHPTSSTSPSDSEIRYGHSVVLRL